MDKSASISRAWGKFRCFLFLRRQAWVISKSPLFDAAFYLASDAFQSRAPADPVWDFLTSGAQQGRKPNPLFDPLYYLRCNPDVVRNGFNPLYHFIVFGEKEGRQPHPLFDPVHYAAQEPHDADATVAPLLHFLRNGNTNRRNPHPLFDTEYYLCETPGVEQSGLIPLLHYLDIGAAEGRAPHRLFDPAYYVQQGPAGVVFDPLIHFLENGNVNGCSPHPLFDTRYYLEKNPDVGLAGTNALIHYLTYGAEEGRRPRPRATKPVTLADWGAEGDSDPIVRSVLGHGSASRFAALRRRTNRTLDILFSEGHKHEGDFSFADFPTANSQIFLNVRDTDSYQRGIPGLTSSIDETARWLGRLIDCHKPEIVRAFGESMGGYAALLFGQLLGVDRIYVVGPFAVLGQRFCRSREWYKHATYDPHYQDITRLLPRVQDKAHVVFPTFELREYGQIRHFHEWPHSSLFYGRGFHPGGHSMNWEMVLASEQPLDFDDGITWGTRYPFIYTGAQIERLWTTYVAIRQREHRKALQALEEIALVDPRNHGIRYRQAVQQALTGDTDRAVSTLEPALKGLWPAPKDIAAKQRVFEKWRLLIAQDYGNVVDLKELRQLVSLFHKIWPDEALSHGERGEC